MVNLDVYKRWEYMTSFKYILLNFIIFIAFCNCVKEKLFLFIHLANLCILIIHYLFYIFLESEFSSLKLKTIQLVFKNGLSSITFILTIFAIINWILSLSFFIYYFIYKLTIPFLIKNVDSSLHFKKRCDLYNINNDDIFPYKYICSFNAAVIDFPFSLLMKKKSLENIECSEIQYLINNNEIINSFIKEYNNTNIYYCDLKMLPEQYFIINPKEDNYEVTICPFILIALYMYLFIKYLILINIYFKNIKPNINMEVDYYYDFGKKIKKL